MSDFHFLRPEALLALIPLGLMLLFTRKRLQGGAWTQAADAHLLPFLLHNTAGVRTMGLGGWLMAALVCMVLALAGPAWKKLPMPSFESVEPRVLVLDMSEQMAQKDLAPDRLMRARFKLYDIFNQTDAGPFGLIAYTSEPFLVSPLTNDGKTISELLPSLTLDVMPVAGSRLDAALDEAEKLLKQAGFNGGQILVLAATPPDSNAFDTAARLKREGILTSVLPVRADGGKSVAFAELARTGGGKLLKFTDDKADITSWLALKGMRVERARDEAFSRWQDEGRWLIIPALFFLLPLWRRGREAS